MRRYGVVLLCCAMCHGSLAAQTKVESASALQEAGGMAFEVASVREDKEPFKPPSFALSPDASFRDPSGRFHADFSLEVYIEFAYKVWLTVEERRAMLAGLPAWVGKDRFEIQATAPLHATKDQYRLMMQALLADRFGLKLHFDDKEMPVLAMTLIRPGKPGPKLIPHAQGPACDETAKAGAFPGECYTYMATVEKDGRTVFGSRATSMPEIGNFVGSLAGGSGEIARPVVDQTGLTGLWDYTLHTAMPSRTPAPEGTPEGPTMLEALRDELGLQLKPGRAVVRLLVVDHVERPTAN